MTDHVPDERIRNRNRDRMPLPYYMIKIHDMATALTSIRQNAHSDSDTATSIGLIERRSNDEKLAYILYVFNNLTILYKQYRTFI